MDEEYDTYEHITKYFKVKEGFSPAEVGASLGTSTFIGNDSALILNVKYEEKKFSYVLSICSSIYVKVLLLAYNKCSEIPRKLSGTWFPNLQVLDLSCNGIESIEEINRIFMPSLKILNLEGNKITTLTQIKKCCTNHLKNISLKSNLYSELGMLSQLPFYLQTIDLRQIPSKSLVMKFITINVHLLFT